MFLHCVHAGVSKCVHLPGEAFLVIVGACRFIITPNGEQKQQACYHSQQQRFCVLKHQIKVPEQLAALVAVVKVGSVMSKESQMSSLTRISTQKSIKSQSNSKYTGIFALLSHTYAALLLLLPFGTTAAPFAWVPLAPIPRFGSGNSINTHRGKV